MQLTIIGKPECHLCDVAKGVISEVIDDLAGDAQGPTVHIEELSIDDDPQLNEKYWEQIPVVLVDGVKHAQWRVKPEKLKAAILNAAG